MYIPSCKYYIEGYYMCCSNNENNEGLVCFFVAESGTGTGHERDRSVGGGDNWEGDRGDDFG